MWSTASNYRSPKEGTVTAKTRSEGTDKAAPAEEITSPTTIMVRASGLFALVLLLLFGVLFIKQALHDRVRNNAADAAATYCQYVLNGSFEEAAAMESANTTSVTAEHGRVALATPASSAVNMRVADSSISDDELTASARIEFTGVQNPIAGQEAPTYSSSIELERSSTDESWRITTPLVTTVEINMPVWTPALLIADEEVAANEASNEESNLPTWTTELTLYPGAYTIGAHALSADLNIAAIPERVARPYGDNPLNFASTITVPLPQTPITTSFKPFVVLPDDAGEALKANLLTLLNGCIHNNKEESNLCPDFTRTLPADTQLEFDRKLGVVSFPTTSTFRIDIVTIRDPATGWAQCSNITGTLSYNEEGQSTIEELTVRRCGQK